MKKVSVAEAKAGLSALLDAVGRGERVVITKRNTPVAELRSLGAVRLSARPWGRAKGTFVVPEDFNEPLPDAVVEAFEGKV